MLRFVLTLSLALLLTVAGALTVQAGPKVYLGVRVASGEQVSLDRIDHSAWSAILRQYVDDHGMVNYRGIVSSKAAVSALDSYLKTLSTAGPQIPSTRGGKLAFWINAYNAVTVRGIVREYPTSSIRNHTAKIFGYNIWKDLQLYVGGRPYSLDQIEHEILRKMDEPRIHFAIVCASVGCPRLLNEAYLPEQLEQQLDNNARDFFARSRNFRYDQPNQRFYLSSLLSWFGRDFGSNRQRQLRRIARWLPTEAARQAALRQAVSVTFLDYDWSLNDQHPSAN